MRKPALLVLALLACHAPVAPEPAEDLQGLTLPLLAEGPVRLELAGSVGGAPAQISLELSQPLVTATRGCFPGGIPKSERTLRVQRVPGGFVSFKEVQLQGARLGPSRLGPMNVGLVEEDGPCRVTLGGDALAPYALRLSLASRTLRFEKPMSREAALAAVPANEAAIVLDLSRDPSNDWPLLPVQLEQGGAVLTGVFALSTAVSRSQVSGPAAKQAGLTSALALIERLHLPAPLPLPPGLGGDLLATDSLALAPELAIDRAAVKLREDWKASSPIGVLGSDAWGRFDALFDLKDHYLLLARPRVSGEGAHARCEGSDGASGEACFALAVSEGDPAPQVTATVWRSLPRGARVYLDALDAEGQPLASGCRVGFTFAPSSAGASIAKPLPWPHLTDALQGCAELSRASGFRLGGFEEGAMPRCLGNCAFAEDLHHHQAVCACESGPEGRFSASAAVLQRFDSVLHRASEPTPEREPEGPPDP
jgi:hypothetical protein